MIKETFRYIEYSNEKSFTKHKHGKVELKQFTDDLVFAANFDSTFDAIYSIGAKTPETIIGDPIIANFDVFGFGQHGELKGTVIYEEESFRHLENEGSIKFWLRSSFNNAVGEQWFKNGNPVEVIPEVRTYGLTIYKNNSPQQFQITLEPGDDGLAIYNKLAVQLIGNGFQCFRTDGKIRVTTSGYGEEIFITSPMDENVYDLITLMGGVNKPFIANGPTADVEFFRLSTKYDDKNAISITHKTNSHIHLKMYNYLGDLVIDEDLGLWSNQFHKWYAFELNWNEQIGQLFIGGELNKVFMTGIERKDCRTFLHLKGSVPNYHLIDELQIYDKTQHNKNYKLEVAPLTPYDSQRPYLDIHYGQGFKENEIKDIIVDGTLGLHFAVKIGVTWYYYFNGSWRNSDGSFTQSTELNNFEAKFAELFFNEKFDLIIRVFFNSDGWTPISLDEISIIREIGSQASAYITGEVRLANTTVDLSDNFMVLITTDKGSMEVDLTTAAADPSEVTLEEIKQAIREAGVPGLASVSDDGNGRLVLIAETSGAGSYISISDASDASALDIIWGSETSDTGEDDEFTGGVFVDYSEIFRWIRSRLGAPLVPVELTDEQLEDCLGESVWHYNRWRNFRENIIYANLHGNPKNGWEIPAVVGGEENILEIIMEPKYPASYYMGRNDLMGNIFIQQIFNHSNIMATAADHHIALVASRDLNLILNTEVRWEVINRRLFIHPIPSDTLRVSIKYKSALTLDEIVTSQNIKDLTLALAKITLGNIRSTFGNQVPGGDGMLQLNGSELKAEGQQDRDRIIEEWKKSTNVYEFIIG
jgi:hypothetical protein